MEYKTLRAIKRDYDKGIITAEQALKEAELIMMNRKLKMIFKGINSNKFINRPKS